MLSFSYQDFFHQQYFDELMKLASSFVRVLLSYVHGFLCKIPQSTLQKCSLEDGPQFWEVASFV